MSEMEEPVPEFPPVHDPWDEAMMRLALDQALNAQLVGEVPVGAVIVRHTESGRQVIATGYNRPITTHDPSAHAEMVALRHAAQLVENYRLPDCELFVTLEPCAMCAMALMHARFKRVVFGAWDPKTGAAGSVVDLFAQAQLNHHTEVLGGVLADACGRVLKEFFAERRAQQKQLQAERRAQANAVEGGTSAGDPRVAGEGEAIPDSVHSASVPSHEDTPEPIPTGEVHEWHPVPIPTVVHDA